MTKIVFSEGISKTGYGDCVLGDHNIQDKITIYKDAPDKLKTLIHELIHNFLHEKNLAGYKSRMMNKLNHDERFVDGLAVRIKNGIMSCKTKN